MSDKKFGHLKVFISAENQKHNPLIENNSGSLQSIFRKTSPDQNYQRGLEEIEADRFFTRKCKRLGV